MAFVRFCNKDHFVALARDANRKGYNRQLSVDSLIDLMDDDGTNVLWFTMLHEHIAGVLSEPHIRSVWFLKLKDRQSPYEVLLDISMENFDSIPKMEYVDEVIQ